MFVMFKLQVHYDKKRQEKSRTHYEWQSTGSALVVFCLFILYKNNKIALNFNLKWKFQNNMFNKCFNRGEELFLKLNCPNLITYFTTWFWNSYTFNCNKAFCYVDA